jgi:hypothetical protein
MNISSNPLAQHNDSTAESVSNKPYKALQTLHNAQIGVRLPNRILIHAVDQYLKYLKSQGNDNINDNNDKITMAPLSITKGASLEQTVEDM